MKQLSKYLGLIIFLLPTVGCHQKNLTPDKAFSFLIGDWEYRKDQKITHEVWVGNDSELNGKSQTQNAKNETIFSESMELVKKGKKYFLVIQSAEHDVPVTFEVISHDTESFVAENDQNDFPKRIVYLLKSNYQQQIEHSL